jgi:hypothetical protein
LAGSKVICGLIKFTAGVDGEQRMHYGAGRMTDFVFAVNFALVLPPRLNSPLAGPITTKRAEAERCLVATSTQRDARLLEEGLPYKSGAVL